MSIIVGALTSFLILCPTVCPVQTDMIRIEHIGPEDKPIPALTISAARIKVPSTEGLVLVTKEVLQLIVQEVRLSTLKNSAAPSTPAFGTFKVTFDAGGEQFYLTTQFNAIRFFNNLRDVTREKDRGGQLDNHLSYLVSRIE